MFEAAAGILDIVNANMMGAVRVISVEQGEDPREFALVAFGGAGPLHAADIARNMGIRRVIVPTRPGLLSAMGLLHADVRGDFSLTRFVRALPSNLAAINAGFAQLRAQGEAWLEGEVGAGTKAAFEWSADVRYVGQNFELILPVESANVFPDALDRLLQSFHARHREFYGYDMPEQGVEIVNLRLVVTAARDAPPAEQPASGGILSRPSPRHVASGFQRRDLRLPPFTSANCCLSGRVSKALSSSNRWIRPPSCPRGRDSTSTRAARCISNSNRSMRSKRPEPWTFA